DDQTAAAVIVSRAAWRPTAVAGGPSPPGAPLLMQVSVGRRRRLLTGRHEPTHRDVILTQVVAAVVAEHRAALTGDGVPPLPAAWIGRPPAHQGLDAVDVQFVGVPPQQ